MSTRQPSRSVHLDLRINVEEKQMIKQKAAAAGLTLSEFIRQAAMERDLVHQFDRAAVRQLKKIGYNLNQAVRHFHQGDFSVEVRRSFERCLNAIWQEIGDR